MSTPTPSQARRGFLLAAATGAALPAVAATPAALTPLGAGVPLATPRNELVYEAQVDIGEFMNLGPGPVGERRMVPITGGVFAGPGLKGKVLPGGADRQLVRSSDGARLLDALYELQTDDGAVITVRNRVLVRTPKDQPRYALSTIDITAPNGPYGWLNDFVYVGTLDSLRPQREAVLIRVYKVVMG